MAHDVNLPETFRGPMDLLLYLVKRDEIDIHDIPIAYLTKEYLAELNRMRDLDVDIASEFLTMASMLMEIKARMLLPPTEDEEGEEEDSFDPRAGLVQALLEYRQFKEAASLLGNMADEHSRRFERLAPPPEFEAEEEEEEIEGLSSLDLYVAFDRMARSLLKSEAVEIVNDEVPTEVRIEQIVEAVKAGGSTSFRSLLSDEPTKGEMVGFFIAILELVRLHKIKARQSEDFTDIYLDERTEADDFFVTVDDPKTMAGRLMRFGSRFLPLLREFESVADRLAPPRFMPVFSRAGYGDIRPGELFVFPPLISGLGSWFNVKPSKNGKCVCGEVRADAPTPSVACGSALGGKPSRKPVASQVKFMPAFLPVVGAGVVSVDGDALFGGAFSFPAAVPMRVGMGEFPALSLAGIFASVPARTFGSGKSVRLDEAAPPVASSGNTIAGSKKKKVANLLRATKYCGAFLPVIRASGECEPCAAVAGSGFAFPMAVAGGHSSCDFTPQALAGLFSSVPARSFRPGKGFAVADLTSPVAKSSCGCVAESLGGKPARGRKKSVAFRRAPEVFLGLDAGAGGERESLADSCVADCGFAFPAAVAGKAGQVESRPLGFARLFSSIASGKKVDDKSAKTRCNKVALAKDECCKSDAPCKQQDSSCKVASGGEQSVAVAQKASSGVAVFPVAHSRSGIVTDESSKAATPVLFPAAALHKTSSNSTFKSAGGTSGFLPLKR